MKKVLLILLIFVSCQAIDSNTNSSIKAKNLHKLLPEPKPGDWLYQNKEKEQSFNHYINGKPAVPNKIRNKIYLLPIGSFTKQEKELLNQAKNYLELFFGLKVFIKPGVSSDIIPDKSKRIKGDVEQLHTKYILYDILLKSLPKDAVGFMGITTMDLYPKESWNYVFGQASPKKRVAVSSMYRLKKYNSRQRFDFSNSLLRIIKTSSHEITHMMSVLHCMKYRCIMNGSNNLPEADAKPSYFCPECERKFIWATKNDKMKRYKRLRGFFKKYNLKKEYTYYLKALAL